MSESLGLGAAHDRVAAIAVWCWAQVPGAGEFSPAGVLVLLHESLKVLVPWLPGAQAGPQGTSAVGSSSGTGVPVANAAASSVRERNPRLR